MLFWNFKKSRFKYIYQRAWSRPAQVGKCPYFCCEAIQMKTDCLICVYTESLSNYCNSI